MATPHNEALSVAAEQGLPGLVALAWAIWCAIASAARIGGDRTLATTHRPSPAAHDRRTAGD